MYDFTPSQEQQLIMERATEFMISDVYPNERFMVKKQGLPEEILRPLQSKAKELGIWAAHLPKEVGGTGMGYLTLALLSEMMGRSPIGPAIFGTMAPDAGNAEILWHAGSDEQKERYLMPLVEGKIRSCFAMTEPEVSGSDPTMLKGRAILEGDEWIINASKWLITGVQGSSFAVVMALTDPDNLPHKRFSLFIVDTDHPGFQIVRDIPVLSEHFIGGHGEIRLEDCRVPSSHLLGERGHGFRLAQLRLGTGRIIHAMRWIGMANRSLEWMLDYALTRGLKDHQTVQHLIADSAAQIEATRMMTLKTAWKMDQGLVARKEISIIKYFGATMLHDVIDRAMEVQGMLGLTEHSLLASFYREARAARIYDGADEVHRTAVGKEILRDYHQAAKRCQ
jgi:acyl-CoA dehydrogenase